MADNFNLRQFLTENKLTKNAKLLKENADVTQAFSQAGITGEVTVAFHSEQGMSEPEFQVMNAQDALAMIASEAEGAEDVLIGQGDEIDQQGDLDPQTQGLECKLEVAILDHGTYEVYQGSNEENLDEADWRNNPYTPHNFDGVAKYAQEAKELQAVANRMFPEFGGELKNLGAPLTPEQRNAVWATWAKEKVAQEKAEREAMLEAKQSPRDKYLTRLVENALGIQSTGYDPDNEEWEDDEPFTGNYVSRRDIEEGEEMVKEKPLPKYENIEKLMQEIEHGTNEAAYKHKMAKMKEVAEMLEARVSSLEEGDGAEFVDAKKVKQMKKDIMTLRKQAEKLEKEYDKKFGEKKARRETQTENKVKDFNLRKFLTENKLTTNSKMLKESEDEEGDGWKYFDIDGDEVEGLYMDTVDGVKIYSMTDSSVFDTCSYILEDEEGYVETVDIDVSGQPVDSEDLQNDYELSSYIADFISDDIAKQLGEEQ